MFEVVATFAKELEIRIFVVRLVLVDVMDLKADGAVIV
jgi:hypothetical protein